MDNLENKDMIPVWEKALLTLNEAAKYTGIGINKLRDMTEEPECDYVLWVGKRRMFKRKKLEEFLEKSYSL